MRHWPLPILEPDKCWNKALLCRQVCEVETNSALALILFPRRQETRDGSHGQLDKAATGKTLSSLIDLLALSFVFPRPSHSLPFILPLTYP